MSHNVVMKRKTFAERLKELREERGLTQRELSEVLKVHHTAIRNWETRGSETNFSMLIKIADFFDVSIDYLLGRVDIDSK